MWHIAKRRKTRYRSARLLGSADVPLQPFWFMSFCLILARLSAFSDVLQSFFDLGILNYSLISFSMGPVSALLQILTLAFHR